MGRIRSRLRTEPDLVCSRVNRVRVARAGINGASRRLPLPHVRGVPARLLAIVAIAATPSGLGFG
jgi:hypothetical protein